MKKLDLNNSTEQEPRELFNDVTGKVTALCLSVGYIVLLATVWVVGGYKADADEEE